MAFFLVSFFLCSAFISVCRCCSCLPSHPQNEYCNSAFVIRAKVLSETTEEPRQTESPETALWEHIPEEFIQEQVYTLRVLKIYKGGLEINNTEGVNVYGSRQRTLQAKLYTPARASSCHVPLRNGTVYLLTGQILNGRMRTGGCKWRTEWSSITRKQRAGIRRFYGENCMCQVGMCFGSNCNKMLKGCEKVEWRAPMKESCKRRESYCMRDWSDNTCAWRISDDYKKCLKKIP
ncbi:metalloproteinase inhibitor 4-like [Orbicella faveolata]|uniref:metalloproteinase inhibitor 4-like n=1 Tax=Orbicella faveolata TaxID=48498 RepID=UPI0009E56FCC|nr:metalloproteinase inhibitor 4-like [Orbicella faveolata]